MISPAAFVAVNASRRADVRRPPCYNWPASRREFAAVDSSTLTGNLSDAPRLKGNDLQEAEMDGIVYLVGLIVIIMFILSLFGLR